MKDRERCGVKAVRKYMWGRQVVGGIESKRRVVE